MRHFYLLCLFLCPSIAAAQLSISPSSTGDSYLYVENQLLYVESDINLEKNKSSKTEASIYLRKEAQLIQGIKPGNSNSGDGALSIFQEGTSNAYNYNYWCLPIEGNIGNFPKFGAAIFEPLGATESTQAIITSALDGKASPLSISNRWIYKFSGINYSDWVYIGEQFITKPGEGFTMKGVNGTNQTIVNDVMNNPGNNQRYDFRGRPNDGEISLVIKKDEALLTGNPYPSALDLDLFLFDNANTTGIAYFWDASEYNNSHYLTDYEGGYGAYSPGAQLYAPAVFQKYNKDGSPTEDSGASGNSYARSLAPVAQGFMLIGTQTGPVTFKNSQRRYISENSTTSQFKRSNTTSKNSSELSLIKLNIEFNDLYIRQLFLAFRPDSTNEVDHGMDALQYGQAESDVAWWIENDSYVINVLPFDESLSIPFALFLNEDSRVQFVIAADTNHDKEVYLFDAAMNSYFNLSKNERILELTAGEYLDRFFLSFKDDTQSLLEPTETILANPVTGKFVSVVQNEFSSELDISITGAKGLEAISIYNLNGGLVYQRKLKSDEQQIVLSTSSFSNAVYILKINTSDKHKLFKKIVIKN